MKIKSLFLCFSVIVLVMGFSSIVRAGTISGVIGGGVWDGWTQFQDDPSRSDGKVSEDWVSGNFVDPGYGGQKFDAEYLLYKRVGNKLFLGLQTGFDIGDGKVTYGGKDYYTGDIALSFDGIVTTGTTSRDSSGSDNITGNGFEYAIDFGLNSRDYGDHAVNADGGEHDGGANIDTDTAGLYSVSKWNNHVINSFTESNPFAMDGGSLVDNGVGGTNYGFTTIGFGSDTINSYKSYYRQVSFDITDFLQADGSLWVDANWTMSCGNDAINGSIHEPVPEPATIALLGIGLAGFAGAAARRKFRKSQNKQTDKL